jgi:nickel/cobalt transporter (NicO) family protein
MRRALMLCGLVLAVLLAVLWLTGAFQGLGDVLQSAQRTSQERLAAAIRALRGGEAGALAAFWTLCFGYGLLHAAGPGHGKLLIGGYGVARRVPVLRLANLALAASLAQAAVAVLLVYAVLWALGLTRQTAEGVAERWMTPIGHAMIAGLGLWLIWRGVGDMAKGGKAAGDSNSMGQNHSPVLHSHHHPHHLPDMHDHGPSCTHAHGPSLEQVESLTGWRDGLALVAGIALRPCTGALFVLIVTYQLGLAAIGVAGAFVMGLGTAVVTISAALFAVWAREGALSGLRAGRLPQILPVTEVVVGGIIAIAALGLLIESL